MDHSLRFSLLGAASFVLTTANPWVMVAAITSVTVIGTVGLVVRDNIFAGRNPDRCSRKLGGTVILYNELKLFVSLNCFNVDYLLLNFSQSRLAVSLSDKT